MTESKVVYSGLSQQGIDLERADGELSIMHNCIKQGSSIKPIRLSKSNIALENGERLLFIDDRGETSNYIVCYPTMLGDKTILSFFTSTDPTRREITSFSTGIEVINCLTLGNNLVVLASDGVYYSVYKDGVYNYLGNGLPELDLEFRLIGSKATESIGTINTDKNTTNNISGNVGRDLTFEEEACAQLETQLRPKINKFVAESYSEGKFVYPFFVRYALRTYSGDYVMQSPPILMTPNRNTFPIISGNSTDGVIKSVTNAEMSGYRCDLYFTSKKIEEVANKYSNVITSIDFFVSEPLIANSEAAIAKGAWQFWTPHEIVSDYDRSTRCISGALIEGSTASSDMVSTFNCLDVEHNEYKTKYSLVPPADYPSYYEKLKDTSVFYKVASISLADYKNSYSAYYISYKVPIDGDVLNNLAVQQTLEDGYLQHERLSAKYAAIYNSRLNIANLKRYPYPFAANSLMALSWASGTDNNNLYTITTYISDDNGGSCEITSGESRRMHLSRYIFYPNPKAYRMVIKRVDKSGSTMYADIPLSEHNFLNGAYYYGDINFTIYVEPKGSGEEYISTTNKVYTSEVNNPYVFPLSGITSVGDTTILGIAPTTKALSEGQFGQFPMYVFTDEGVWALEVNANTGLYSSVHPITRDACINSDSITQLDDAVLFATDKGLMLLSGSKVDCLSKNLDGSTLDVDKIVMLDRIFEKEGLSDVFADMRSFNDYLSGCKIAYDYPNSRIVVFNPQCDYAYIYSFESGMWCTISGRYTDRVVDYPKSYILGSDNSVIDFSKKIDYDDSTDVKYMLLSRPLAFGDDELKSINKIINRGVMRPTLQAMVLYASVDGYSYFPIGSVYGMKMSRIQGSAYKYFRIAIVGKMNMKEGLVLSSFYVTPKWRNKGR